MLQRKLRLNVGKDTHVRNKYDNIFTQQGSKTYSIVTGEIDSVQPEPLFSQTLVTVKLSRGGRIDNVAYPNAFIDPVSGNLHGVYEGPIKNQMVAVAFENGNINNPFVVERFPYQGCGNTLYESKYRFPLQTAGFYTDDVIIGHKSGSYLSFNTGILPSTKNPGSIFFKSINDFEIECQSIIKLTANTQIELNGNTNWATKYTEMKTAFDQLKSDFNNHVHTNLSTGFSLMAGAVAVSGSSGYPTLASTADMSSAKNTKVLM